MQVPLTVFDTSSAPLRETRESDMPVCPICADTMVAATASVLMDNNTIRYLWSCDNCGYGFITSQSARSMFCREVIETH